MPMVPKLRVACCIGNPFSFLLLTLESINKTAIIFRNTDQARDLFYIMKNIHAIVLAAGKGTRMNATTMPKVLFPVAGRPMLAHLLDSLAAAGITRPIIVVGFLAEKVKETFGDAYDYVLQSEQLGTGHAVQMARESLENEDGCTLIINGDHPFFRPATFQRLVKAVNEQNATVAVLSGLMHGEEFDAFGRLVTDDEGHVQRIVEVKDATEEEKAIRLMNLGGYAVDNKWLWHALEDLTKSAATGEYYITDIVGKAVEEGKKVVAVRIEDEAEALGINTLDHLAEAEKISQTR